MRKTNKLDLDFVQWTPPSLAKPAKTLLEPRAKVCQSVPKLCKLHCKLHYNEDFLK